MGGWRSFGRFVGSASVYYRGIIQGRKGAVKTETRRFVDAARRRLPTTCFVHAYLPPAPLTYAQPARKATGKAYSNGEDFRRLLSENGTDKFGFTRQLSQKKNRVGTDKLVGRPSLGPVRYFVRYFFCES